MARDLRHRPLDLDVEQRGVVETLDLEFPRIDAHQREPQAGHQVHETRGVAWLDPSTRGERGERSIHQPGVEVVQTELPRERPRERRLAAARCTVDRHHPIGHGSTSMLAPIPRRVSTKPGKLTSADLTPSTSVGPSAASPATASAIARR